MQSFLSIFNTDLVNKYKLRIPLRELASSFIDSPSGLPQCLGHDNYGEAYKSILRSGRCGVSPLERVASDEVRARGKLVPPK